MTRSPTSCLILSLMMRIELNWWSSLKHALRGEYMQREVLIFILKRIFLTIEGFFVSL